MLALQYLSIFMLLGSFKSSPSAWSLRARLWHEEDILLEKGPGTDYDHLAFLECIDVII